MLPTWSTCAYLLGLTCLGVGLLKPRHRRSLMVVGGIALATTAVLRLGCADGDDVSYEKWAPARDRQPSPPSIAAARLFSERDMAVAGAAVIAATGRLDDPQVHELPAILDRAYDRMLASSGSFPTPVLDTAFDRDPDVVGVLVVEPDRASTTTVVFLHGFAGSFAVQCWHVARAFESISPRTVCPSVGFRGDWWTPRGGRVLDRVLARVRADGAARVYLVGLSNGARGAASLARTRGRQLDGVVVISGAAPVAPPRGVPVLAVQGRDDRMFPSRFARGYARSAGRSGTYAPIDGGHFVFLDRWTDVEGAVTTWLSHLET